MIAPTKHFNLDTCVLNIAALIIEALHAKEQTNYLDLLAHIVSKLGQETMHEFPLALGFLFLLGRIEYLPTSDSIVLTVPINNTKVLVKST